MKWNARRRFYFQCEFFCFVFRSFKKETINTKRSFCLCLCLISLETLTGPTLFCLSVYLASINNGYKTCLSIWLVCLSDLSVYLTVCLFDCPSIWLSVRWFDLYKNQLIPYTVSALHTFCLPTFLWMF